jgi:hypothetical protein
MHKYAPYPNPDPNYKKLLEFSTDFITPACVTMIQLQERLILQICQNVEPVAEFAILGLKADKEKNFWSAYDKYSNNVYPSPDPVASFEEIIDCVVPLEAGSYSTFCEQVSEIATTANIDLKRHANLRPAWLEWAKYHNELLDRYETIKRDPAFGKLLRLREGRWGAKVSLE